MSVKNKVLKILEQNRDTDMSGESIAASLGVSRNAVWKAVNVLRDDGYDILSSTNKGYRLSHDCDLLSEEGIRATLMHDVPIFTYRLTDSTNTRAKLYITENECDRALFVAEEQTDGRGRLGRNFYSPYGSGLYMTYVISPHTLVTNAVTVTTAACVAVLRAIKKVSGKTPLIKWVNDIYLDNKKICGILTEAVTNYETGIAEHILIGVGINVSTNRFPSELKGIAGSLGGDFTRNALCAAIADNLYELSLDLDDTSYLDFYREHSLVLGKNITYYENGTACNAVAVDIDETGGLVVGDPSGAVIRTLRSGEISVRLE